MNAGIHELAAVDYHADPCEPPSLSSSIAHVLCTDSPAHAKAAHPRLNPDLERQEEEKFDVGNVAHSIILEGTSAVEVIDAPDWRTKVAKEARDAARAAGRTPLLLKHWRSVEAMVEAAQIQLEDHGAVPPLFDEGAAERCLVWEEPGGVMCRARLDWLRDDRLTIDDLKTTSASANPERWSRTLFTIGADVQAAFYLRGLQALTGAEAEFRWAVIETSPPYALSVISPAPDVLTIGRKKVQYALDVWRRCLRDNDWPAYPARVAYAELPPWEESRWLAKEERELAA